jgi:hypothetical protein
MGALTQNQEPTGVMDIKVIDGKMNRFVQQISKDNPLYVNI